MEASLPIQEHRYEVVKDLGIRVLSPSLATIVSEIVDLFF